MKLPVQSDADVRTGVNGFCKVSHHEALAFIPRSLIDISRGGVNIYNFVHDMQIQTRIASIVGNWPCLG